jgi:hypothetical protein
MKMTVKELMDLTGAKLLTPGAPLDREVTAGYACDMLSWVMGHEQPGMVWITVQTHLNVIAVAELIDAACVVLADCGQVDEATLRRAQDDGFPLLASDKSAFALSGLLWSAGIREPQRS